jgi:hypothetical protein
VNDPTRDHFLKVMTLALDAALEIHPESFSIDGNGGIYYETEWIPGEVIARLEPNDFDYMIDQIVAEALKLKKCRPLEVAA